MPKTPPEPAEPGAGRSAEERTAIAQEDVARMAAELRQIESRLLEHCARLPDSYPSEEVDGREPMSLPYRMCDELRMLATETAELAGSLMRTASRSEDEIHEEWLRERLADARVDAREAVKNLRGALGKSDGARLREGARILLGLAETIAGAERELRQSCPGENGEKDE